jgi:hypothetical protein
MIPGLEERLMQGSDEDVIHIGDLVRDKFHSMSLSQLLWTDWFQIQKGSSNARSDNTKSLKGAILDWITLRGQPLNPPLARNIKTNRGFHHERTGALLCPAALNWSDTEYAHFVAFVAVDLSHCQAQREPPQRRNEHTGRPVAHILISRIPLRPRGSMEQSVPEFSSCLRKTMSNFLVNSIETCSRHIYIPQFS